MKGFYFKKNKKVETTPNPNGTTSTSTDNSNTDQNNSDQQIPMINSTPPFGKDAIPAFCLYSGVQDGNCIISLNVEKIFCFNPYIDVFARGGIGLSDFNTTGVNKKFIFSGGIAGGLPILKIGAEYGYSGFINGNTGSAFYGAFIRLIPKRKSLYFKLEMWKLDNNGPENNPLRGSFGLGIAF